MAQNNHFTSPMISWVRDLGKASQDSLSLIHVASARATGAGGWNSKMVEGGRWRWLKIMHTHLAPYCSLSQRNLTVKILPMWLEFFIGLKSMISYLVIWASKKAGKKPSVGCLFILLMVSLDVQKLFILMWSYFFNFAFASLAFGVTFTKTLLRPTSF